MKRRLSCLLVGACGLAAVLPLAGCESYWFLPFAETGDKAPSTGAFSATDTFTENNYLPRRRPLAHAGAD